MEKMDASLSLLQNDGVDLTSRSAALQLQLDDLVSTIQARESNYRNAVIKMRGEYDLLFDIARTKAGEIVTDAQKAAAEEVKNATETRQTLLESATADAAAILAVAEQERTAWEAEKALVTDIQKFKPVVKVNVGGTKFTTSRTTLCRFPDTMIGAMYSGRHELVQDDEGYHFIDRDGTHFRYILNFLRSPETFVCELTGAALKELKNECEYYGLKEFMFPTNAKSVSSFMCNNTNGQQVHVARDINGVWCTNNVPLSVCSYCLAADYSGFASILNFNGVVESYGGEFNSGIQPRPTGTCRRCRTSQVQFSV